MEEPTRQSGNEGEQKEEVYTSSIVGWLSTKAPVAQLFLPRSAVPRTNGSEHQHTHSFSLVNLGMHSSWD
jgi:hypothetical protein